jgi:hypothetical protein
MRWKKTAWFIAVTFEDKAEFSCWEVGLIHPAKEKADEDFV